MPVMDPVVIPMETLALLADHVPPLVPFARLKVVPTQTARLPVMTAGRGFTLTWALALPVHPVPLVAVTV